MGGRQYDYVLEMRDITKSFPGVKALDGMNLKVRAGTVHVLVGENGAGKSTLMKILSGVYTIDDGEIVFKGETLGGQDTGAALERGISMIHQELSPILDMTIAENIFLGREPSRGKGVLKHFVDFDRMFEDTKALMDRLGERGRHPYPQARADEDARPVHRGDAADRDLEGDLARRARGLPRHHGRAHLRHQRRRGGDAVPADRRPQGERGCSRSSTSRHKMDEIFQIADDITVMRDGQFVAANPASHYDVSTLIAQMVGRTISNIFPKEDVPIGEEVLAVVGRGLTTTGRRRLLRHQLDRTSASRARSSASRPATSSGRDRTPSSS